MKRTKKVKLLNELETLCNKQGEFLQLYHMSKIDKDQEKYEDAVAKLQDKIDKIKKKLT